MEAVGINAAAARTALAQHRRTRRIAVSAAGEILEVVDVTEAVRVELLGIPQRARP